MPQILSALLGFAALGALTFLAPPPATHLLPYFVATGALGEVSLTVWLLAVGVNAQRWKEQASAAVE
jgi:hypothetical protein